MSRTRFRVNPHFIITRMSRNSLLKTGAISEVLSDCNGTETHNHLARMVHLTECSCHVNARVSELIHTVKLPECQGIPCSKRVDIWSLSDCSGTRVDIRYCAYFRQEVPWHSGNYRGWIHSETRMWHDENIQWNAPYSQHSSIIWPVWLNVWIFVYELSGIRFESSHLKAFWLCNSLIIWMML